MPLDAAMNPQKKNTVTNVRNFEFFIEKILFIQKNIVKLDDLRGPGMQGRSSLVQFYIAINT